jgi:hypothetical protein
MPHPADTFRFQHHALPVPHITATNCILQATERLADAIAGVQEAPPDKLVAITSLRALLLGKECLSEPVQAPVAQNPVTTPVKEMLPEEYSPVIMWDPMIDTMTDPQQEMCKSTPLAPRDAPLNPTWIEDNHNNVEQPPPPAVSTNVPATSCYAPHMPVQPREANCKPGLLT